MADNPLYELEVLGTCTTNTTEGSQHGAEVDSSYLWSYAQEEALVAMSERSGDGCYRLIQCPERRAKRIAARYADLYLTSVQKSDRALQFYWPALAAFVVKDIVEGFRFAREDVLKGTFRTWTPSKLGSQLMTKESPFTHAARTYAALAKGNLWLFMDVYPWLWFFQEYGIAKDGGLNEERLNRCVKERQWAKLQSQSKNAVNELPFSRNWLARQKQACDSDETYKQATEYVTSMPIWSGVGYGYDPVADRGRVYQAHAHVRRKLPGTDRGYLLPIGEYWRHFSDAYYVLDESRREWKRIQDDAAATARLEQIRSFVPTDEIEKTYAKLIEQWHAEKKEHKKDLQLRELVLIAQHEQVNVLQPLIYDDPMLKKTMDTNHSMSRRFGSWLTPPFQVVYSALPTTEDPNLKTVFDAPKRLADRFKTPTKSLPSEGDRMKFVAQIASDFNYLMLDDYYGPGLQRDLKTIRGWINA